MKIQVGKYTINSDTQNYWITEEYEVTKGKNKGEKSTRTVTGYCWTFENTLKSFRERTLGECEATTLLELLEALKRLYEDMDALNTAAVENGIRQIGDKYNG